jgi:hypothetical protein
VNFVEGNAEDFNFPSESLDLIVANEMIGDLSVVEVERLAVEQAVVRIGEKGEAAATKGEGGAEGAADKVVMAAGEAAMAAGGATEATVGLAAEPTKAAGETAVSAADVARMAGEVAAQMAAGGAEDIPDTPNVPIEDEIRPVVYDAEKLDKLGEIGQLIGEYQIPLRDSPPIFHLNLGAYKFLRHVWNALKPGGISIITEFGGLKKYPQLSDHLDHREYSIHFGIMKHIAEKLGFEASIEKLVDYINLQQEKMALLTAKHHFLALRYVLELHGIAMKKIAYTSKSFGDLFKDMKKPPRIMGIRFGSIADRCMGLKLTDFQVLLLKKPSLTQQLPH